MPARPPIRFGARCLVIGLVFGIGIGAACAAGPRESFVDRKWRKPVQMPAYYQLAVPECRSTPTPPSAQAPAPLPPPPPSPQAQAPGQAQAQVPAQVPAQAPAPPRGASPSPSPPAAASALCAEGPGQTQRSAGRKSRSSRDRLIERHEIPEYVQQVLTHFEHSAARSIADPRDPDAAARFLDHGMALTNLMCADFFMRLAQERQQRNYRRDYFSNINTAFSALLNLTKSSNLATGTVSALFGAVDADYQNVDKHYVAAADLPAAEALVRRALAEQARENGKLSSLGYSVAESRLIQYASTCSFNGIKTLINQSVIKSEVRVDQSGAAVIDGESDSASRYDRAKASQDAGFAALGKCEWGPAERAFEEANTIYPRFQASFEYARALRLNKDRKQARVDALLALANDQGVGRMPSAVRNRLENDPHCERDASASGGP